MSDRCISVLYKFKKGPLNLFPASYICVPAQEIKLWVVFIMLNKGALYLNIFLVRHFVTFFQYLKASLPGHIQESCVELWLWYANQLCFLIRFCLDPPELFTFFSVSCFRLLKHKVNWHLRSQGLSIRLEWSFSFLYLNRISISTSKYKISFSFFF